VHRMERVVLAGLTTRFADLEEAVLLESPP
jgi:hypothetical protein